MRKEYLKRDGKLVEYFREDIYFEGKQFCVRARNEKDLLEKVVIKRKALEDGNIIMRNTTTVKRWSEEWLETYKKGAVGLATYRLYQINLKNHIIPVIGNMRLRDVKPIHLQKILNNRIGHSKTHINKIRQLLCQLFKAAKKNQLIPIDPSEELVMPKATDGTNRALTDYERKCILKLAETHRAGLWILTMLYCGVRPQETVPLKGSNIDYKRGALKIFEALEAGTNDTIGGTKSASGVRIVPIPNVLLEKFKAANIGPFEYLFTQPTTGNRHTKSSMYTMWRSFKRDLDILMGAEVYSNQIKIHAIAEDLDPYCLRHTFCTDLQAAGVPINVAKELMGHSDISLTSRIYTHFSEMAFNNAAEAMNNFHSLNSTSKLVKKNLRRLKIAK